MKALRQKASERNPDEFAFGMMSSTTKNGVRVAERGRENGTTGSLSMDVVKLLKTQDEGYLQTILQQTRKERERTEKDVILAETDMDSTSLATISGKRKVFGDDGEIVNQSLAMEEEYDSFDDEPVDEPADKPEEKGLSKEQIRQRRQKRRTRETLQTRLEALTSREKDLATALDRLHEQRAKMHNTIGGVNKDGVKFKIRERKR